MITKEYNEEQGFLDVKYEGWIELDEILDFDNYIDENKTLPRKLKILTDVREARYNFELENIQDIIESLKTTLKKYIYIRHAFIHESPRETAYSLFLQAEKKITNYDHSVFYTREKALHWLLKSPR